MAASISKLPEACTEQQIDIWGHISVFLGVKIKDKFSAWRPSCLKFSQQSSTSMLNRKEKQLPKEAEWLFIVLIQFISLFYRLFKFTAPFSIHA